MRTPILDGIRKIAGSSSAFSLDNLDPGTLLPSASATTPIDWGQIADAKSWNDSSGFSKFLGKHPKGLGMAALGLTIGGSILGGKLVANQQRGKWYNQGHQAATRTYSPMLAARYSPRGGMGVSGYARRR